MQVPFTDSTEFLGSVTVIEEVAKRLTIPDDEVKEKRRRGRLHKVQGDVCMMAGSPRDALNNYRSGASSSLSLSLSQP
jgi:hypothetical protein